ncbi:MAG: ATP-binding protein [Chloroflexota bacterium]
MERLGDILARYTTPTVISRESTDTSSSTDRCPLCDGAGWVYHDLPIHHPDRGRGFPCECTERGWEARRRRRLLDESGLGALSRLTFETFGFREGDIPKEQSDNLFDVWDAVKAYAEQPWPQGWLLLMGNYGSGKTHLAAAAVNHRVSRLGRSATFVVVPDFLDHLRSAFGPSADGSYDASFDRLRGAEFLVLDDLGAEYGTSWATEKLFQLFNHRYNAQLPTLFTSNVDVERIEPRIRSRLMDQQLTAKWVIQAPDYRVTRPGEHRGNAEPEDRTTQTTHLPAVPAKARRARP